MKLKELYRKIDQQLLRKRPVLWVLGVHIYLPILLVSFLLLFLIGAAYSLVPLPQWRSFKDFFETINLAMVLPTILLVITFIIRQVKYNSKRVHLKLPHNKSFVIFLYFMAFFFVVSALPFAANFGALCKTGMVLNKAQYEKDIKVLNEGYCHFYMVRVKSHTSAIDQLEESEYEQLYNHQEMLYKMNPTKDSLILYRKYLEYTYRSSFYNRFDTIPLEQAYTEMEEFIAVAEKYQGEVINSDPRQLVHANLTANKKPYFGNGTELAFNHFVRHEALSNNVQFNDRYLDKSGPYFVLRLEFWEFYCLVAIGLAMFLIVLCSVKKADFGWSMLIVALQPTVYGIVLALSWFVSRSAEEAIALFWLYFFIALALYIIFVSKFKSTLRHAYAIALHLYIPILVPVIMILTEDYGRTHHSNSEDVAVVLSIISAFVSTYLFSWYYKREYINPEH